MAWLAVMLFVGGAVALWRLAGSLRARQQTAAGAGIAALVFLLGWLYLTCFSHAGAHVPWDDFVFFERLPAHLSVLFILALCWHLPSRVRRGLIVTLLAIAGGYGLLEVSGPLLMPVYGSRLDDTVPVRVGRDILDRPHGTGQDGRSRMSRPTRSPRPAQLDVQVTQSTGWTCGPAALAWALQLRGMPVSEKRAAFLSATTPFHGTPDRGVLRAAHRLGVPAHMERGLSYEQLMRLPHPSLVTWHLGGMVMHFVVLICMDEQGVTIGDPMLGEVDYSKEEFLAKWGRSVVVLE